MGWIYVKLLNTDAAEMSVPAIKLNEKGLEWVQWYSIKKLLVLFCSIINKVLAAMRHCDLFRFSTDTLVALVAFIFHILTMRLMAAFALTATSGAIVFGDHVVLSQSGKASQSSHLLLAIWFGQCFFLGRGGFGCTWFIEVNDHNLCW